MKKHSNIAVDQLKSIISRVENLEESKVAIDEMRRLAREEAKAERAAAKAAKTKTDLPTKG